MSSDDRKNRRAGLRERRMDKVMAMREELGAAIADRVTGEVSRAVAKRLGAIDRHLARHAAADRSKGTKLSREQIAAAALAIADAQGFEAVSMRKIATVLGSGTMSLYHYVRTKDDLVAIMDDAIMGEVLVPPGQLSDHWRAALTAIAGRTNSTLSRHPWAMTALMQGRPGPNGVRHFEQALSALKNTGLEPHEKFMVIMTVDDYVSGHVLRATATRSWTPEEEEVATETMLSLTMKQIATGKFPQIAALVGDDPRGTFTRLGPYLVPEARFDIGLTAILDGLALKYHLPD